MGVAVVGALEPHQRQQLLGLGEGLRLAHAVGHGPLGDGVADPVARVERGVGVLEDHLHAVALATQRLALQVHEVSAGEAQGAAVRSFQAHHAAPQGRLAGARFADDADGFALDQRERDVLQGAYLAGRLEQPALGAEDLVEPHHLEQRGVGLGAARLGDHVAGNRFDQRPGVVVGGVLEHRLGFAEFDDLAVAHHADPVGDFGDDPEVVGDEHHRHAAASLQVADQFEDLRLGGDVERGGRFVGDQQLRLQSQCHGDHHPLALAAGELEGVGANRLVGVGDADLGEQRQGLLLALPPVELAVGLEDFGDLGTDPHQRIEGGHRLLEDHADAQPAQCAVLLLGEREQVLAVEQRLAAAGVDALGQQAHHRVGGHRLAGAGFAHHAQDLAAKHVVADVFDGQGAVGALG